MWIYRHIAAKLINIRGWTLNSSSAKNQLDIFPPIADPQHFAGTTPFHCVGAIERSVLVDAKRPLQSDFLDITFGSPLFLERHDQYITIVRIEPGFFLPQLQQMFATRQSREMTMEDEQEPTALIITESMCATQDIRKFEVNRRRPCYSIHSGAYCSSRKFLSGSVNSSNFSAGFALNGLYRGSPIRVIVHEL